MDSALPKKPLNMADLLPGLSGILSKDAMQTLTAKKRPRPTLVGSRTADKHLKPKTIAEMKADLLALTVHSPRRFAQGATSAKKKWNSSVKLENKTVSHTANGQMKHNSVRKVLNFQQPKSKVTKISGTSRITMMNVETLKFPKPEIKMKKPKPPPVCNSVRISGICLMPETPLLTKNPGNKSRMHLTFKQENMNPAPRNKKTVVTPKISFHKQNLVSQIPDTPKVLSNISWKSSCDDSFIQNEKDIENLQEKTKPLSDQITHQNIAEVSSHHVSTPFSKYRNVNEFFNNSSDVIDNSATFQDDTIMSFGKTSENSIREESVIVSLCDMLKKARVTHSNVDKASSELGDLLEVKKQTQNNIKMIENGVKSLNLIKESQLKSLQYITKLINEKSKEYTSGDDNHKTDETSDTSKNRMEVSPSSTVFGKPCSVIKSCQKSPSYKIPKKNMTCLRKKVFHKSMPNVSNVVITPSISMGDRALNMYMKMKEHMDFLNTPVVKQRVKKEPDTPAITSQNLQMQLDKLYDQS